MPLSIDEILTSSGSMDSCHESLNDSEVVVNDLGQGRKAVGGAGSIGHHLHAGLVGILIDAHHEHGSVGGGGRDDDLLGASLNITKHFLK